MAGSTASSGVPFGGRNRRALATGAAHFGITGEDLVREKIPAAEQKVVLLEGLRFGRANVVVAVPAGMDRRARHGGPRQRRDLVPAAS